MRHGSLALSTQFLVPSNRILNTLSTQYWAQYEIKTMIKKSKKILITVAILLVGIGIYAVSSNYIKGDIKCAVSYEWINTEFRCRDPKISKAEYVVFKESLTNDIEAMKTEGMAEEVAVYFRDLHNGPSFGINDREKFIPASLLKVPVLMAYLKTAEENSILLTHKLVYKGIDDRSLTQMIVNENVMEIGKSYTVDELLFRMIAHSDNDALFLLWDYLRVLNPQYSIIEETYASLGMINPGENISLESLTVKSYAGIFRMLYNASYLSNEYSEKALHYLSHIDYVNGLRNGIPADIHVAHKFGERYFDSGEVQLHDCGIVYYPENPYLLCVMTKGTDFDDLAFVISTISRKVYEEVESRRINTKTRGAK